MDGIVPPPSRGAAGSVWSVLITTVVREEGTRTVVVLRGEADPSTERAVCGALSKAIRLAAGDVVIDLAEVEFIDSAIVDAIAAGREMLERRGRELSVRSPSTLAALVLDVFGLAHLIEARQGVPAMTAGPRIALVSARAGHATIGVAPLDARDGVLPASQRARTPSQLAANPGDLTKV